MQKIMIVEDDALIARLLQEQLTHWGYAVSIAEDFNQILQEFESVKPELVLLDISLPFFNGFYWCREIRRISQVPIMFLSGASDNLNIVMAMNMGADDFIAKPFDTAVLIAKIQALLRRSYHWNKEPALLRSGAAALNCANATLSVGEKTVELTKNEARILAELMSNAGKIVSRDTLMQRLWETDEFIDDNTLTVNVTRLRRKLKEAGLDDFIKTKKGLGYLVE